MMRILLIFIISFYTHVSVLGQTTIALSQFKSYKVPDNPDTLYKYNSDANDWTIHNRGGPLYATNTRQKNSDTLPFKISNETVRGDKIKGDRSAIKVANGYLVGFYGGEWGGALYWFSKNGKRRKKISNHNIVQFLYKDNKVFAIEGLAHGRSSEGGILEIHYLDRDWRAKEYLKLPDAPDGFDLNDNNEFVIITSKSLLIIHSSKKITTLIDTGIWHGLLYPTSLVIQNNIAFMGMRKGIFKYNLSTRQQEWLLPN